MPKPILLLAIKMYHMPRFPTNARNRSGIIIFIGCPWLCTGPALRGGQPKDKKDYKNTTLGFVHKLYTPMFHKECPFNTLLLFHKKVSLYIFNEIFKTISHFDPYYFSLLNKKKTDLVY